MCLIHRLYSISILCIIAVSSSPSFGQEKSQDFKLGVNYNIKTLVFFPSDQKPKGAVLVLSGSNGVKPAQTKTAQRMAHEGYLGIVPYYNTEEGLIKDAKGREAMNADFVAIMLEISDRFSVPRSDFYAHGFSLGGYYTRELAARSQIKAGMILSGAWTYSKDDADRLRHSVTQRGMSRSMLK